MINLHGSLWRLWEMVCYVCVCSCVYSPSSCLEKGSEMNVAADRTGVMHPKRRTTSNNLSFSINSLLSVATWVIFTGSLWRLASQFLATCRQPNTDGLNGIHQLTDLSRLINSLSLLELSVRLSFSQLCNDGGALMSLHTMEWSCLDTHAAQYARLLYTSQLPFHF